jgi:polyisoprenoid-binding protein YceI
MTRVGTVVYCVALAALAFFGGSARPATASAQSQAAKVSYAPIPGGEYVIDPPHSLIGFSIRHFEINWVQGRFKDFTGAIRYDESDVTKSSVTFAAKIESVDTGVAPRDQHLRTADFFDAAKFPEMTFKSTKVERKGKDGFILYGDFTLKGVTRRISFPFTMTGAVKDPRGGTRFGIEAHTKIDRREYAFSGGKPMEGGGIDVGNEVTINLYLEALKPAPKPAS